MTPPASKPIPWYAVLCILAVYTTCYLAMSQMPLVHYTIPFLPYENRIPFLPWTFIIYISAYAQYFLCLYRMPQSFLRRAAPLLVIIVLIAFAFFVIFPVQYPRATYEATGIWGLLQKADGGNNCFPSLHVTVAIALAYCYSLVEKKTLLKVLMWLWVIAIMISVLTTKQHYLIDVGGGMLLSGLFCWMIKREMKKLL